MWNLLCLASFTLYNIFEIHTCCSMYLYLISFYCWIVVHCMDEPHLVYPFFSSLDIWVGFYFCLLGVMMSGSECMKIFVWWYVFISLVKIPGSGIADVTFFFFFAVLNGMWGPSSQGFEATPPTLEVQTLTHWTTREVPLTFKDIANWFLKYMYHLTFP